MTEEIESELTSLICPIPPNPPFTPRARHPRAPNRHSRIASSPYPVFVGLGPAPPITTIRRPSRCRRRATARAVVKRKETPTGKIWASMMLARVDESGMKKRGNLLVIFPAPPSHSTKQTPPSPNHGTLPTIIYPHPLFSFGPPIARPPRPSRTRQESFLGRPEATANDGRKYLGLDDVSSTRFIRNEMDIELTSPAGPHSSTPPFSKEAAPPSPQPA